MTAQTTAKKTDATILPLPSVPIPSPILATMDKLAQQGIATNCGLGWAPHDNMSLSILSLEQLLALVGNRLGYLQHLQLLTPDQVAETQQLLSDRQSDKPRPVGPMSPVSAPVTLHSVIRSAVLQSQGTTEGIGSFFSGLLDAALTLGGGVIAAIESGGDIDATLSGAMAAHHWAQEHIAF